MRHAPFIATVLLLLAGLWLRWPSVRYKGVGTQRVYNDYIFDHFAYSDIASLFFRDRLRTQPLPYLDYPLEYPVGMGGFILLLNTFTTTVRSYMLLSSAVLGLCLLATVWLVDRLPQGKRWLAALAPGIALYSNLNWDGWGILLMVAALVLGFRHHWLWAGLLWGMAVWTKFFPIVCLPLVSVLLLRERDWRALWHWIAGIAAASLVINGPLLLVRPDAWWYFFRFNSERGREINLWTLFDRWGITTATINRWSAILLVLGVAVMMGLVWRSREPRLVAACCALIAWFFFINKIYSPQYSLWISILLAGAGAPVALVVAWGAIDIVYFWASFSTLGLSRYPGAGDWFVAHTLMPAMVGRELLLLVVMAWAMWQLRTRRRATPAAQPA